MAGKSRELLETEGTSGPTESTVRALFALSRNACAFPGCTTPMVEETHGQLIVLGEVCHIRGRRERSPRFDRDQTEQDRHSAANLILLCAVCHKRVDSSPDEYTVQLLHEFKRRHEAHPGARRHSLAHVLNDVFVHEFSRQDRWSRREDWSAWPNKYQHRWPFRVLNDATGGHFRLLTWPERFVYFVVCPDSGYGSSLSFSELLRLSFQFFPDPVPEQAAAKSIREREHALSRAVIRLHMSRLIQVDKDRIYRAYDFTGGQFFRQLGEVSIDGFPDGLGLDMSYN